MEALRAEVQSMSVFLFISFFLRKAPNVAEPLAAPRLSVEEAELSASAGAQQVLRTVTSF